MWIGINGHLFINRTVIKLKVRSHAFNQHKLLYINNDVRCSVYLGTGIKLIVLYVSIYVFYRLRGDLNFATVVCTELGYEGVETVSHLSETDIESSPNPITFYNPDCNIFTTSTMQDCGLRPDLIGCGADKQVYLKCSGSFTRTLNDRGSSLVWYLKLLIMQCTLL